MESNDTVLASRPGPVPDTKDDTDAILSLVFGLVGLLLCQILAPLGLLFTWRHYKTRQKIDGQYSILAVLGGIFALIGTLVVLMFMAYFLFVCAIYALIVVVYVVFIVVFMVFAVFLSLAGVAADSGSRVAVLLAALSALMLL